MLSPSLIAGRSGEDLGGRRMPDGLQMVTPQSSDAVARDVYLYVIGGHKVRNPAAAMALIERLS